MKNFVIWTMKFNLAKNYGSFEMRPFEFEFYDGNLGFKQSNLMPPMKGTQMIPERSNVSHVRHLIHLELAAS